MLRAVSLAALAAAATGCPHRHASCPPGYTPICQSGAMHGTQCTCEPPPRYRDEH
jgi:hypothetical protein